MSDSAMTLNNAFLAAAAFAMFLAAMIVSFTPTNYGGHNPVQQHRTHTSN